MSECMAVWVGERQRRKKVLLIGLFLQYFALCEKSVTFSLDYNFFFSSLPIFTTSCRINLCCGWFCCRFCALTSSVLQV